MIVTEPKAFGAQGYCTSPENPGARYFIRVKWEDMEPTGGRIEWDICSEEEGKEAAAQGIEVVSVKKDLPGLPGGQATDGT